MAGVQPIISIKAGKCTQSGTRITADPEPGLLYLFHNPDDELLHFCWKPRSALDPEDDLIIIPGDAKLVQYPRCTTGRVVVLRFSSSSQRHFFWLQVKSESSDLGYWSPRDIAWVERFNAALRGPEDEDEEMGDILGSEDVEEEGSASRRGGADGARAFSSQDAATDLAQIISGIQIPQSGSIQPQQPAISLHDLLAPSTTTPLIADLTLEDVEALLESLPPGITPPDATPSEKKDIIKKALHSPQFSQSLVTLSIALGGGGLKGIADSLGVRLAQGDGNDSVEIFVAGVKTGEMGNKGEGMEID